MKLNPIVHCRNCPDEVWGRGCPDEGPPDPQCPGMDRASSEAERRAIAEAINRLVRDHGDLEDGSIQAMHVLDVRDAITRGDFARPSGEEVA